MRGLKSRASGLGCLAEVFRRLKAMTFSQARSGRSAPRVPIFTAGHCAPSGAGNTPCWPLQNCFLQASRDLRPGRIVVRGRGTCPGRMELPSQFSARVNEHAQSTSLHFKQQSLANFRGDASERLAGWLGCELQSSSFVKGFTPLRVSVSKGLFTDQYFGEARKLMNSPGFIQFLIAFSLFICSIYYLGGLLSKPAFPPRCLTDQLILVILATRCIPL